MIAPHQSPLRELRGLGRYPLQVMGVALLGAYLISINTTVLGLALPTLVRDLGATASSADWIVTAYLMALTASMPLTGWLAERWGRRRALSGAMLVFTLGATIGMLSPNLPLLLLGRVLQGFGGGPLMPLGVSMIYDLFPVKQRGTALGVWGIAVAAAPGIGPPLGGWLVTNVSWRWVFGVLSCGGLAGTFAAWKWLKDRSPRARVPFDLKGWVCLTTATTSLVVLTREAPARGLTAPLLALALLLPFSLVSFIRRSKHKAAPLLDLSIFGERTFAITMLILFVFALGQYTRLNFLPIALQVLRGQTALEVGLVLSPAAIAAAVAMPLGGRLLDRFGPRLPVAVGLTILSSSMAGFALLQPDTPRWVIIALLLAQAFGGSITFSPVHVTAMTAVHSRLSAQAASLTQLNRQLSAAVGTAIMAALLVSRLGSITPEVRTPQQLAAAQAGFSRVFLLSSVLIGAALILSAALPNRNRMQTLQQRRVSEREPWPIP